MDSPNTQYTNSPSPSCSNSSSTGSKQRRRNTRSNACRRCRSKKLRCHYVGQTQNKCASCAKAGLECIFKTTPDGIPRGAAYIEALEAEIAALRAQLRWTRTQSATGPESEEADSECAQAMPSTITQTTLAAPRSSGNPTPSQPRTPSPSCNGFENVEILDVPLTPSTGGAHQSGWPTGSQEASLAAIDCQLAATRQLDESVTHLVVPGDTYTYDTQGMPFETWDLSCKGFPAGASTDDLYGIDSMSYALMPGGTWSHGMTGLWDGRSFY